NFNQVSGLESDASGNSDIRSACFVLNKSAVHRVNRCHHGAQPNRQRELGFFQGQSAKLRRIGQNHIRIKVLLRVRNNGLPANEKPCKRPQKALCPKGVQRGEKYEFRFSTAREKGSGSPKELWTQQDVV